MARHGAAGAPRCATLSNIGARRGRSTSHRPTLLNRRLCLYGPLCTANFTLMGMLHLIARRPHASRKYVKYAVTELPPLPSSMLFFVSSQFSLISLVSFFFFLIRGKKEGGEKERVFFSRVYRVTYTYRLIDIYLRIERYGLLLLFLFYLISIDRRCDRVTRKVREQASLFVLKNTRFVRNLSFFSLCAVARMCVWHDRGKIWIMIHLVVVTMKRGRLNFKGETRYHIFLIIIFLIISIFSRCTLGSYDIHRSIKGTTYSIISSILILFLYIYPRSSRGEHKQDKRTGCRR